MQLTTDWKEFSLNPKKFYAFCVDGGGAEIEEFRNGAWRPGVTLADGVTSEVVSFTSWKLRVSGAGSLSWSTKQI